MLIPYKIGINRTLKFIRKSAKLLTLIEKILTLENLKEVLKIGCKVMLIDFNIQSPDETKILFEGGPPL